MATKLPYILPFAAISKADIAFVGGKGANLGEMMQAGFPVPPGFCVTTAAFAEWMQACPQVEQVYAALEGLGSNDLAQVRLVGEQVRAYLQQTPMPPAVAEALRTAWAADDPTGAYAVRSSATAEDLPDASFAGQQDTFLNVQGEEALLTAVHHCWISLFTDRAILYRRQNGFAHRQVALAVVVQQLFLPEISGILFTADPVTGERHMTTIDASYGLGEALVAGLVSADLYKVDQQTWTIAESHIAEKERAIRPLPEGGTITEPIIGESRTAAALQPAQIIELAQLGDQIARHYGQPQDIEWAYADGRFAILQTRPITSLFPLPPRMFAHLPLEAWFSFGAVQGMLAPITPLGQDSLRVLMTGAARYFGINTPYDQQPVVWPAGERLFINITGVLRHPLGRKVAQGFLKHIEPGIVQALVTLAPDSRLQPERGWFKWRTLRHLITGFRPLMHNLIRAMRRPEQRQAEMSAQAEHYLVDWTARMQTARTLPERVALLADSLAQGFPEMLPVYLPLIAGGMASLTLVTRLTRDLPANAPDPLLLTRGLPHNVTTEMDLALWQTARRILADDTAVAHMQQTSPAVLAQTYLHGELPLVAQTAVSDFLAQYGMRGIGEIDLGRPRWQENPEPIMQTLQSYLQITDVDRAPDAVFARGAAIAEAAVEPLAVAVRQTHGGWLKAKLLRAAVRRIRALAGMRESPKFLIIRAFGVIRAALLDSGAELAAAGVIAQADDLFYLHLDELQALAAGEQRDWAAIVARNRQVYAREMRRQLIPRLLLSDGRVFYEGVRGDGDTAVGDMIGSPVSPGVVEGVVHVVLDPHSEQLTPGEILVCPGTDPAWTPLFLAAGGLVMEVGGLMTHGSVVAREYGIPAVVGVHEATSRLQTGQRIRVDGSTGVITRLE